MTTSEPTGRLRSADGGDEAHRSPARRTYGLSILLLGSGGALAFIAFGQTWVIVTGRRPGLPSLSVSVAGRDLAPAAAASPLLLLAAALAILVTAGVVRQVVGVLAVLIAILVAVTAIRGSGRMLQGDLGARFDVAGLTTYAVTSWWLLALVAAVVALAGGLLAARYGAMWPGMSSRYRRTPAAPVVTGPLTDRQAWDVLDAGDDPTLDPSGT